MKIKILLVLFLFSAIQMQNIEQIIKKALLVTKEYAENLKRKVEWQVAEYENNIFKDWTDEEFRGSLGMKDNSFEENFASQNPVLGDSQNENNVDTQDWSMSNCIHEIRDQGKCGSCWAFSTASIISDKCCLKGNDHGWLSVQEMLSCTSGTGGCDGSGRQDGFNYAAENGLVPDSCYPYSGSVSKCEKSCQDGKSWDDSHVCKCKNVRTCKGEDGMIACLKDGPIQAGMTVYKDFSYYSGGIYKWDGESKEEGKHAIKLVGYGPGYWKCANSWGDKWGENGYFKIARDECDIIKYGGITCDIVD